MIIAAAVRCVHSNAECLLQVDDSLAMSDLWKRTPEHAVYRPAQCALHRNGDSHADGRASLVEQIGYMRIEEVHLAHA